MTSPHATTRIAIISLLGALLVAKTAPTYAEAVVIAGASKVADVALLDGEFSTWNFGASRLLETGLMGGIYAEHQAVSLLRFDLTGITVPADANAVVRLYKPKSYTQTADVEVCLHEVNSSNPQWKEGTGICEIDSAASSWQSARKNVPWAGGTGLGAPGIGFNAKPLAQKIAPADRGLWLEFPIPIELVRKWAAEPKTNSGIVIRLAKPATEWGQHAYFHSTENELGRGPQLVIHSGESSKQAPITNPKIPQLARGADFEEWAKSKRRLARFATENKLDRQQTAFLFHMDTVFRGHILRTSESPLNDVLQKMKAQLAKGETTEMRASLEEARRRLLIWEYLRETEWYTSGTLADLLSPLQLAAFYGSTIYGGMESSAQEEGKEIWQPLTGERLDRHVRSTLKDTHRRLQIVPGQDTAVDQIVADCERREHDALRQFRAAFADVQSRLAAKDNSPETLQSVKTLFVSHERFLYYQSIFNTPRWTAFMKGATPESLASWVLDVREEMYRRRVPAQQKFLRQFRVGKEARDTTK